VSTTSCVSAFWGVASSQPPPPRVSYFLSVTRYSWLGTDHVSAATIAYSRGLLHRTAQRRTALRFNLLVVPRAFPFWQPVASTVGQRPRLGTLPSTRRNLRTTLTRFSDSLATASDELSPSLVQTHGLHGCASVPTASQFCIAARKAYQ
jgi:hypothetical protein